MHSLTNDNVLLLVLDVLEGIGKFTYLFFYRGSLSIVWDIDHAMDIESVGQVGETESKMKTMID